MRWTKVLWHPMVNYSALRSRPPCGVPLPWSTIATIGCPNQRELSETPPSGGGGPSIPIPAGLPTTGQKFERTFKKAEKRETKGRSAASMTTQQSVDASAYADGFITPPLWDESKVEGYIFDSLAGGLLVGTCIQPVPPVEAPPGSGPSGGGGSSTTLICTGTRQVSVTYY